MAVFCTGTGRLKWMYCLVTPLKQQIRRTAPADPSLSAYSAEELKRFGALHPCRSGDHCIVVYLRKAPAAGDVIREA